VKDLFVRTRRTVSLRYTVPNDVWACLKLKLWDPTIERMIALGRTD